MKFLVFVSCISLKIHLLCDKMKNFFFFFRNGVAVLHTRERVRRPGTYILKIRATVENLTLNFSTLETEPFYLTVHLIVTK